MTLPNELTTVTILSKYLTIALFIFIPIIAFFLGLQYQSTSEIYQPTPLEPQIVISLPTKAPQYYIPPSQATLQRSTCQQFMGLPNGISQYETDEHVLSGCDNETFIDLDHQYAKDKNFVYYKPMPNANFMTVILERADPKTFEVCSDLALDKNHVYQFDKIVKDMDPTVFKERCDSHR